MSYSKSDTIKVIFFLRKDLNDEPLVTKIRYQNGDWYLFDEDHQEMEKHRILESKILAAEFDNDGTAEIIYYLNDKTKRIYINIRNQFAFNRKVLIRVTIYEDDQRDLIDYSTNNVSLNSSINANQSAGNHTSNRATNPNNNNSNNKPPTNQPNNNNSPAESNIELESYDCDLHNPFEFMSKFESKFRNEKNKFSKLVNYLPEDAKQFAIKSSYKMTWNNFVEKFLRKYGERYRKSIKSLDRSEFKIGGDLKLMDFVLQKFQLYETHFAGVPESVQINQIINSMPEKYSKKLFFNLDNTKEDFIERVKYVETCCDSEDSDSEDHKKDNGSTKDDKAKQKDDKVDQTMESNKTVKESETAKENETVKENKTVKENETAKVDDETMEIEQIEIPMETNNLSVNAPLSFKITQPVSGSSNKLNSQEAPAVDKQPTDTHQSISQSANKPINNSSLDQNQMIVDQSAPVVNTVGNTVGNAKSDEPTIIKLPNLKNLSATEINKFFNDLMVKKFPDIHTSAPCPTSSSTIESTTATSTPITNLTAQSKQQNLVDVISSNTKQTQNQKSSDDSIQPDSQPKQKGSLVDLIAENSDSSFTNSDLDSADSDLSTTNSDLNAKKSDLNAKSADLNAKNSDLNAKSSDLNAKNSDLNAKSSDLNAKNSDLNAKNSERTEPSTFLPFSGVNRNLPIPLPYARLTTSPPKANESIQNNSTTIGGQNSTAQSVQTSVNFSLSSAKQAQPSTNSSTVQTITIDDDDEELKSKTNNQSMARKIINKYENYRRASCFVSHPIVKKPKLIHD